MGSAFLGVIDDARGRQHRRVGAAAAAAACATIALALAIGRAQGPPGVTPAATSIRVASTALLTRAPYAGVACRTRTCDSAGLTVWLRRPALSVTATILGHSFPLTTAAARPYMTPSQPSRTMFVGYLTPLRLITDLTVRGGPPVNWPTPADPNPLVSLRINEGGGRVLLTRLHVPIQPGWG